MPLLIRAPFRHIGRPGLIEQPVSHIDLVPTLLELMDSESRPSLPGQSLVPLLRGSGSLRTMSSSNGTVPPPRWSRPW